MRVTKNCKRFSYMAILAISLTASLAGYSIYIDAEPAVTEKTQKEAAGAMAVRSAVIETVPNSAVLEIDDREDSYLEFEATAYCDLGVTFSGVYVQRGIVAADPRVLPIGSVIEVNAGDYSGIYTVMDTGGVIKGEIIDIFMPDYEEAVQFGRQQVEIKVIRKGWIPDYETIPNYDLASSSPAASVEDDSDATL